MIIDRDVKEPWRRMFSNVESTQDRPSIRVIATYSGGLDSILAAVLMQRLGFDVLLLHVQHLFSANEVGRRRLREAADRAGLPLMIVDASEQHLETIRHPKHGYGQGMNPCIDCRIFMLKIAKRVMEEEGALFVVTGEVLGQRPKSQHFKALLQAAEESGLGDRLLRPLCAQLLPDTLPVTEGWIQRDDLLAIQGRSRGAQMRLAEEFGVSDYPQPAGGCVLIEKAYAGRVRDAFGHLGKDDVGLTQFRLFGLGRHSRIAEDVKVIVGRNYEENEQLAMLSEGRLRIDPLDVMGPTSLVDGAPSEEQLLICCSLAARYCDHQAGIEVRLKVVSRDDERVLSVLPLSKDDPRILEWRIG
jgi:tRNA-specific 2-thiouridylase